jgi:glutathione S-transferase
MIVIHDFPHGARGQRVAWLCEEMGLPYAMEPVSFPTDSAYRSLNLFGTVPYVPVSHRARGADAGRAVPV